MVWMIGCAQAGCEITDMESVIHMIIPNLVF